LSHYHQQFKKSFFPDQWPIPIWIGFKMRSMLTIIVACIVWIFPQPLGLFDYYRMFWWKVRSCNGLASWTILSSTPRIEGTSNFDNKFIPSHSSGLNSNRINYLLNLLIWQTNNCRLVVFQLIHFKKTVNF
jgi:hypothetical protein